VFRFITEGTVEEKIIERADRKLFLDAAVIQQGRLAEQHSSLEKDELMKMVRFGADQILSGKGGSYTDEDIDALIAKGEEKTNEIQAMLQTDVKHNLADFKLLADNDGGKDTFEFGGKDYRGEEHSEMSFINLPQRQRKRNYDVNEYFRETMNAGGATSGMKAHAADAASKKRKKGPAFYDFQLFDRDRLNAIAEKERALAAKKETQIKLISDLRAKARQAAFGDSNNSAQLIQQAEELEKGLEEFVLSPADLEEKTSLHAEGFPDWNKKDFKAFCTALERHGRYDFATVAEEVTNETGKTTKEVGRYFVAFWTNYRRIQDWKKVIERIERGEKKILRLRQIRDAIQEKIERHLEDTFGDQFMGAKPGEIPSANELLEFSWPKMKISYGGASKGRAYQEEEDAFLIAMMYRHGYGAAERIRMAIRRAWQFRFDWYFKSRSAEEIQKRCDLLVKIVEKENEDVRKSIDQEKQQQEEQEKSETEEDKGEAGAESSPQEAEIVADETTPSSTEGDDTKNSPMEVVEQTAGAD
jgi:SWI/SNF-related matrix-associated actin-dependent regulator of chromatin subfamily A member 5